MLSPLFIGTLNGLPLRLFEAPRLSPAMAWPSFDDLVECLGLSRSLREHYLRRLPIALKQAPIAPGVPCPPVLLADTGMVRTIPYRVARSMIEASVQLGACEVDAMDQYEQITTAALEFMARSVPVSEWPAFYDDIHLNTFHEPLPPEWKPELVAQIKRGEPS